MSEKQTENSERAVDEHICPDCKGSAVEETADGPDNCQRCQGTGLRKAPLHAHGPHAHGFAQCDACGHRWAAVWPLGADALECPQCRSTDTDRDAI
jgi:DnaJ-class molecular chaperone